LITCPHCGYSNTSQAKFCSQCAHSLADDTAGEHTVSLGQKNYCPYCEASNPPGAVYCGNCGRSLTSTIPIEPAEEQERRGGIPVWLIISAGVIFLVAATLLALPRIGVSLPGPLAALGGRPTATATARPAMPRSTGVGALAIGLAPSITPEMIDTPFTPPIELATLTPFPTPTRPAATVRSTATPDAGPEHITLGYTSRGTPIEAVRFGNGPRAVLFIGGLAGGYAPSTVSITGTAVSYFTRSPNQIPKNLTVYIVLSASPDAPNAVNNYSGRLNANGVDINRNWGCNWAADTLWQGKLKRGSGGTAPFSETESRVLRDLILANDTAAVVFWQARAEGGLVSPGYCGGPPKVSAALAGIYGLSAGYRVDDFEKMTNQTLNGDASNYLDSQGIPAISVLLPHSSSSTDWDNNLRGVLSVLSTYAN